MGNLISDIPYIVSLGIDAVASFLTWQFHILPVPLICLSGEGSAVTKNIYILKFIGIENYLDKADIKLKVGTVQSISVKGQQNVIDQLSTEVFNGIWRVDFADDHCVWDYDDLEITVTMTDNTFELLNVMGQGKIYGEQKFYTDFLETGIYGTGEINIDVDTIAIISTLEEAGRMEVSGSALSSDVTIYGRGSYFGFEMEADEVIIKMRAGGSAEVYASKTISAVIHGNGKLTYKGEPTTTTLDITGVGASATEVNKMGHKMVVSANLTK